MELTIKKFKKKLGSYAICWHSTMAVLVRKKTLETFPTDKLLKIRVCQC